MRDSRAISFLHWDVWLAVLTHRLPFSVWRSNVMVGAKKVSVVISYFNWITEITRSRYQSHSLATFRGRPMVYNLEVFLNRCVHARAPSVCVSVSVKCGQPQIISKALIGLWKLFSPQFCILFLTYAHPLCVWNNRFWFGTDIFARKNSKSSKNNLMQ